MTTAEDANLAMAKKLVTAELRRRKRRANVKLFLIGFASSMALAMLNGWYVMLAVGVAHAGWIPALPTIGYWRTVLLVVLLRGVFSSARPSSKKVAS